MTTRRAFAEQFYFGDCSTNIKAFLKDYNPPKIEGDPVAGVVPHAGWFFSGRVAARTLKTMGYDNSPDTFIVLGAVHYMNSPKNAVYAKGAWKTPFGDLSVDEEMASLVIDALGDDAVEDPLAHNYEHSIEVQLPFIKYLYPDSKIVPISVHPGSSAHEIGVKLGKAISQQEKNIKVIGSTDLTHYGDNYGFTPFGYGRQAKEMMQKNDFRIINLAVEMKSDRIVHEAATNHNACGSGALAATVAAAETLGADKGVLVEYTTSYDTLPEGDFSMAVGYAGIVF